MLIKEVKMENELKCMMGFFIVLLIVMGIVIGVGVFFKVVSVVEVIGIVSLYMFFWFLGGVIFVCVGLIGVELVVVIFEIGGMIKYIEWIYGNIVVFLFGWV